MKDLSDRRLYAFVDFAYLHGRSPVALTRDLCAGGADLIQLRCKNAPPEEVRRVAAELLPITHAADVALVLNDHWDLAVDLGVPVCHLGQEDFFDAGHTHVRELRGRAATPLLGLSTHAPEQARRAIQAGADYVAIGPVYATGTKPTARPVTLEYVRWAAANVTIPWFAIGGVTLDNLDAVLAAGATRVCVVSAILNSRDVAETCHQFKKRLLSAARIPQP